MGDDFNKLDWRELFKSEQKAPNVKTNNETINEIIAQLFNMKKECAKRDESNCALMSENAELMQQLQTHKN